MSVAACMIVKDGAASLRRAVASVRPHVDEVCVLDTGSTDGTLELLEELAAESGPPIRVERAKWTGDFSAALEQAFALASSDWLLRIDDDEQLIGADNLRRLARLPDDVTHVQIRWQSRNQHWRVRITRPGACAWRGRVHENLEPVGDPLAFVVALPGAMRIEHPVGDDVAAAEHNATALATIAADPDASPWLRGFYGGVALAQGGDLAGGEAAFRGMLDETAGSYELGRLAVFRLLADMVVRRGAVLEAVALLQARDAELKQWRTRSAAGELTGFESLGPDFWPRLDALASLGRSAPCWCGSGRKFKRCCADRVFIRPTDVGVRRR